jgi:hypothetical protein
LRHGALHWCRWTERRECHNPRRPPPHSILVQNFCLPPRYGRSRCLETRPSRPMRHAARNRSGPISPRSKGATVMPSGRRANSCSRLVLRMCRGSDRRSSPPMARISKA